MQFLNGDDLDFFTVTQDQFRLYHMNFDGDSEPTVELFKQRPFRSSLHADSLEQTCRCVALDNTTSNRLAFGFNNGDIFVVPAFEDADSDQE